LFRKKANSILDRSAAMKMFAALLVGLAIPGSVKADDVPKGEKVEFKSYARPYFEKNNSGLMGDASFLAITDQAMFDKTFGIGVVMGKKPDVLPKNAFEKQMVLSVIKRGPVYTYSEVSVTAADGVLYLQYAADTKGAGGTARFSSPLIVAVEKGKWKSVVFMEGGKKVGTVEIKK
jgi:hypothetical protein